MWFTRSSGAARLFRTAFSSRRGARGPAVLTAIRFLCRCRASCAGAWSAPHRHIDRCHLRGERFQSKLRLPGRSLLPSSTLERYARSDPRGPSTGSLACFLKAGSRDPPDLGADFPDAFRSLRPGRKAGFPLLGLSKDRPSIVRIVESALPEAIRPHRCVRLPPSRWEGQFPSGVPPSWFPTTSTVCSSATSQPFCRPLPILGFTSFPPVAKQDSPPCACCPSKLSLRRQLRSPGRIPALRGLASPDRSEDRPVHRAPCPLALSLSPDARGTPPRFPAAKALHRSGREPGPRGLAPSSGPLRDRPFPTARTRCSPGLGWLVRTQAPGVALPRARDGPRYGFGRRRDPTFERPTSRQRTLRRASLRSRTPAAKCLARTCSDP